MKPLFYIWMIFFAFSSCKKEKEATIQPEKENVVENDMNVEVASGKLVRIDSFESKYVKTRPVDIWLPENYSTNKKFAVLYMHDGQMLFDSTTTWNHQEWKVDEVASKLMADNITKEFIVVGIWNIANLRHSEYYPQKPFESLTQKQQDSIYQSAETNNWKLAKIQSDNYLKFLVEEVRPYVNANYSVHTDKAKTYVAGSSMGGLISMYAVCEYPEIFGGAACLSTHWPGGLPTQSDLLPNTFFNYMENHLPSPNDHKFYFDFGTETLDASYPQYEEHVNQVFAKKGYDQQNFRNLKFEGENHTVRAWQKRLDIPLKFLMKKENE